VIDERACEQSAHSGRRASHSGHSSFGAAGEVGEADAQAGGDFAQARAARNEESAQMAAFAQFAHRVTQGYQEGTAGSTNCARAIVVCGTRGVIGRGYLE
jgi:hypothetical protein